METSNYLQIKKRLPKNVHLVAVSKGFDSVLIEKIHDLGQIHFGESKFQEAYDKQILLKNKKNIKWHFIGKIQSNKIRKIVQNFDYIHSVDSIRYLMKISNAALDIGKTQKILIQLKMTADPTKGGMDPDVLLSEWHEIKKIKNIQIMGLMTINPKGLSSNENSKLFTRCRKIADSLKLPDCSMGMSNDWNEAIQSGSTWLRLGSLIFGERLIKLEVNNKR
ncbi:MAG: YggS family pyridoxal phosphate-dependent enzyme [Prochlorococcus sp. SP3034]|nr:YggS family pyridoxal phosphate-dependent enzyme [Prochlorococcus sp. SP3034]